MNVLSLFDGMSCGQIALNRIGIKVDNYIASEIKKHAIEITQFNFPNTLQVGDVTKLSYHDSKLYRNEEVVFEGKIDLFIGGSPCTNLSFAGDKSGLISSDLDSYLELKKANHDFGNNESVLFWEYCRLLNETNPTHFLLENVLMKKNWEDIITNQLGVQPIFINSKLVSAQERKRLYWTNIPHIEQPQDKNISYQDILEEKGWYAGSMSGRIVKGEVQEDGKIKRKQMIVSKKTNKTNCITTVFKDTVLTRKFYEKKVITSSLERSEYRYHTPIECERLQTVEDNHTKFGINEENKEYEVPKTHRIGMLGRGWTVDVICHILKGISNDRNG